MVVIVGVTNKCVSRFSYVFSFVDKNRSNSLSDIEYFGLVSVKVITLQSVGGNGDFLEKVTITSKVFKIEDDALGIVWTDNFLTGGERFEFHILHGTLGPAAVGAADTTVFDLGGSTTFGADHFLTSAGLGGGMGMDIGRSGRFFAFYI